MKKSRYFLYFFAVLMAVFPAMGLSPGDCMVVGYQSSGTDSVSFVTWVELADGESITIADADYAGGGDGSGEGTGGGTYHSVRTIVWTNDTGSPIDPGTVIVITDTGSPSANLGSASGSFGLTNQGEHFFLMQGSFDGSDRLIGDLLFGVDYDGNGGAWGDAGEGDLPGALNVSNGNVSFVHVDSREFNGSRSGLPLAAYKVEIVNVGSWGQPVGGAVLSAESFVDGGTSPEPLADELGAVNSGEVFYARRMNGELPIIDEAWMLAQGASASEADNINGPSCVRIPSWIAPVDRADPAAVYYLYFADHSGDYIRMAWAANLEGPWTGFQMDAGLPLADRGVLSLGDDGGISPGNGILIDGHIASPQVFVDDVNEEFVMYYHGPGEHDGNDKGQSTVVATSADGLNFNLPADGGQVGHGTRPVILGESYFRVFEQAGNFYAFSNTGDLWKAPDPANPYSPPVGYDYSKDYWDRGPNSFVDGARAQGWPGLRPRHFAVLKRGNILYAILTYKEDRPERVRVAMFDFDALPADYHSWVPRLPEQELLSAQSGWEGGQFPPIASVSGAQVGGVNQLRDPGAFVDSDGRMYLFYCGQGEAAIGVAQLVSVPQVMGAAEVVRGEDETFTVGLDPDVTSGMRRISHSVPVEVNYDAEEVVLPMNYEGSGGYAVLQEATVDSGARSFHLAHLGSGASETLTFPDRYYARLGAGLVYRSRLGAATAGQVGEVQVSFDGELWQTLQIHVGGAGEGSFQEVRVDLAGLVGRVFDLRFRYEHDELRDAAFVSGAGSDEGWFLDGIVGSGLETVEVLDEAPFTGNDFTLDEMTPFLNPFLADGTGEDDRFLVSVDGVHAGAETGYGKPFVFRVRTSYEQFQMENFSESQQADLSISGEDMDPDGDGLTNLMELIFGADPHVADADLMSFGGSVVGGVVEPFLSFPWNSDSGFSYQLQMSMDLEDFADIPFTETVSGSGVQEVRVEPAASVEVSSDWAFFRLKVMSP